MPAREKAIIFGKRRSSSDGSERTVSALSIVQIGKTLSMSNFPEGR